MVLQLLKGRQLLLPFEMNLQWKLLQAKLLLLRRLLLVHGNRMRPRG